MDKQLVSDKKFLDEKGLMALIKKISALKAGVDSSNNDLLERVQKIEGDIVIINKKLDEIIEILWKEK